jgi:hypothetical protein
LRTIDEIESMVELSRDARVNASPTFPVHRHVQATVNELRGAGSLTDATLQSACAVPVDSLDV